MFGLNLHESIDESESEDNEEYRTLFCANLDERVTDALLYEVFLQAGPIDSVRIPKDHNGKQRTFGFITYVHKSTLPYAMHLYKGLSLYRKTLAIKYQRSTHLSPIRNYNSPGYSNKGSSYDNSLGSGCVSSSIDSPPKNPFKVDYSPDFSINSSKHNKISKHASSQIRLHTHISPYERQSVGKLDRNHDRDRDGDHNRRRHYNNSSNRNSNQRSSGKSRR